MERIALISLDAIDLKLITVEYEKGGYFNIIDEMSEQIKIGKDIISDSIIQPQKLAEALDIIKMFRKVCDNNGVTKVYAVAINLVKTARNHRSFFEEVYNNTAINFSILSEDEEIKAQYLGVVNFVDVPKGFIIDIEPYTTSIINYNRRNILFSKMLNFGSITLADAYIDVEDVEEKWQLMTKYVSKRLEEVDFDREEETQFIGSGNVYVGLGRIAKKVSKYPLDIDNNYVVTTPTVNEATKLIKGLGPDKTKKLKGISEERADVLLAGLAIVSAINDRFKIEQTTITAGGYKDGVIYNSGGSEVTDRPISDMLGYSLETINKFYNPTSNCTQVYNLSLILFRQLKVLHKLPRNYLKPLKIAASMYDCGKRIKYDNNSKLSFDIILNSKINGTSQKNILLGAFSSLCQNPDNFNLSDWVKYASILDEEDLDAVRKLGVIISLASALDSSKNNNVTDICCDILGDSIIIKTIVNKDASFEIRQSMKLGNIFRRVFKRNLQII